MSPDFKTITPVLKSLASPNGVALSKDGTTLWATETFSQQLHRLALGDDGTTLSIYGHVIPYRFAGFGRPDSAMIDADDSVYVACSGAGKVMVFNMLGNLIGQVLKPVRETGYMLSTTTMAIVPGTTGPIIRAGDLAGRGAWLPKAKTLASSWDGAFQFQEQEIETSFYRYPAQDRPNRHLVVPAVPPRRRFLTGCSAHRAP